MNNIWQLQDAKSKFSEVVERAIKDGAQIITRRGKKTVVVLPYADYEKLTQPEGSLAEFLLSSPFAGSELPLERDKDMGRDPEITL